MSRRRRCVFCDGPITWDETGLEYPMWVHEDTTMPECQGNRSKATPARRRRGEVLDSAIAAAAGVEPFRDDAGLSWTSRAHRAAMYRQRVVAAAAWRLGATGALLVVLIAFKAPREVVVPEGALVVEGLWALLGPVLLEAVVAAAVAGSVIFVMVGGWLVRRLERQQRAAGIPMPGDTPPGRASGPGDAQLF